MIDPTEVYGIAVITLFLSLFVVIGSSLSFGRILADLEYQHNAGLNGVRGIQSRMGLRTHGKRITLGLFGLVVGFMGVSSIPLVWQNWLAGAMFTGILALFGLSSILDWFAERKSVRILFMEREAAQYAARHPAGEAGEDQGYYGVGPAGPQGPVGPQGAMGPAGQSS